MERMKDHIIIVNWNIRGDKIVREIRNESGKGDRQIVIVTDRRVDDEDKYKTIKPLYDNVDFIAANLYRRDTYHTVQVTKAKCIIILGDTKTEDPDAKSALIALAIKQAIMDEYDAYEDWPGGFIAESVNHQKVELLKHAGVKEVICPVDYGLGVIAQSALSKKISEIYNELLEISDESNEIYIIAHDSIPEAVWLSIFNGNSFEKASEKLLQERPPDNPYVLIGVQRKNGVCIINPRASETQKEKKFIRFEDGDSPIFLSYDKPDLTVL